MSTESGRNRVYQVSSNRSSASHKVRYVESSAPPEGDCRLCVGTLPARRVVTPQENTATEHTSTADSKN